MLDRRNREIHIECRPIQMMWAREFDVRNFSNRRVFEPGEVPERYEHLTLADKQPKTMR